MLVELVFVLDALNAKECKAEEHRQDQHYDQQAATGGLRGPDREDDGQAAADQNGGVGRAERGVDRLAGGSEVAEVHAAVDQVRTKQSAEEHDFGGKEDPHAEVRGVALLLLGGEVMQQ